MPPRSYWAPVLLGWCARCQEAQGCCRECGRGGWWLGRCTESHTMRRGSRQRAAGAERIPCPHTATHGLLQPHSPCSRLSPALLSGTSPQLSQGQQPLGVMPEPSGASATCDHLSPPPNCSPWVPTAFFQLLTSVMFWAHYLHFFP